MRPSDNHLPAVLRNARGLRLGLQISSLLLAAAFTFGGLVQADSARPDRYPVPERYKERIDLFVVQDGETKPQKGGIVFTGSSTITMWNANLPKDFEGLNVLGRGFGGSVIADSVFFADKTVIPHEPRQVIFYAGENDIASGLSPQGVLEDFQEFVSTVKAKLPQTQIVYISMKPSPRRWEMQAKFDEANALIKAYCEVTDGLSYVNIKDALLGENGQPREELFLKDRLHLNADGYTILREIIRPLLLPEPKPAEAEAKADAKATGKNAKPTEKKTKDAKAPAEGAGMMM